MKGWGRCASCHSVEPTEADKKPVSIATITDKKGSKPKSTCYSCHKSIMAYSYEHGPASVWACLSCHEQDSSPRYAVAKPDAEICYTCHVEQKAEWLSKKHIHGPVNVGMCSICHNPHASDHPFHLYKDTWNLCVTCHVENGTGMHVLADVYSTEGHPTRGKPDPVRIGKELSCASCHNPHASDFHNLWTFGVDSLYDLCQKCHNKKPL